MTFNHAEELAKQFNIKGELQMINAIEFVSQLLTDEADALSEAIEDGRSVSRTYINELRRASSAVESVSWDEYEDEYTVSNLAL